MVEPDPPNLRMLLRWRWLLAAAVTLAFALGQLAESLLLGRPETGAWLLGDVIGWGLLGGLAVALALFWAGRQERRHQAGLAAALAEQQVLNAQLQRANAHLALLSDVNRAIANSSDLDEVLDVALAAPGRLLAPRATAVVLTDGAAPVVARSAGLTEPALTALRLAAGVGRRQIEQPGTHWLPLAPNAAEVAGCLVLPLHDGLAPVGWIELYLAEPEPPAADLRALLETLAGEFAEAVVSERRRVREARAVYALDRAVTEERARIARDIHDGIAQGLAFLRLRLELWPEWVASDPDRLRSEMAEMRGFVRGQIQELRRAIFALRPVPFESLGFVGGLGRYIEEFAAQQGWQLSIDLSGAPSHLEPELEATAFRTIQEALTNVARHAEARHVVVTIDQVDQGLRILVGDDGQGFEPARAEEDGSHLGLRQMRERLAALRGQLIVLSRPGGGTELRAWVPLAVVGA